MTASLDIPPFPPLTWDGYSWTGEVRLPSWAGYQARRGAYASASGGPSDGSVQVTVQAKKQTLPTAEQVAGFRHLLDHEAAVAKSVAQALLEDYLKGYGLETADEVPEITELSGLRQVVGLSSVHVISVCHDGLACIGFEFGCAWDDEHGAGVMTHRGRVIDTGSADHSFVEWMAREGLKRKSK